MIRHHISLITFASLVAVSPSAAQEIPSVGLDEALRMFAANNLELRIAHSRADEAAGLARQAGAFPNPSVDATHEPLSGGAGSYSETYVTASQRFELSGSRRARSEAGERRAESARLLSRADSSSLAFEVKRAYVDALLSQEARAVTERIAMVFREAVRSAAERYRSGDISLYALRRIGVERARYETLLANDDVAVGSRQRALALLVAPSGDTRRLAAGPLPTATPPVAPVTTLASVGAEGRMELAAARAELEAEEAQARLVRAERVPDVTATGGFKRQSDGRKGGFMGLSLPVPVFDRGAGAVEAQDAEVRRAQERLALTQRQLQNDVFQAAQTYETLRTRSELLPPEGPGEGGDLLDIALVAYEEGGMELVELLDAADALYEARTAEARLRATLWIAYFDLERAMGGFPTGSQTEDIR